MKKATSIQHKYHPTYTARELWEITIAYFENETISTLAGLCKVIGVSVQTFHRYAMVDSLYAEICGFIIDYIEFFQFIDDAGQLDKEKLNKYINLNK